MAENVFEAVKQSVTVREAAQMYGIEVNRSGMACCPFHDDKNPSLRLNEEYFYCFGCGATGDVIDFTARLYNLSPKEAAEKLAQDFGLAYDSQAPPRRRYVRQKTEAQIFKEDRDHAFRRQSRKRTIWAICWTFSWRTARRNKSCGWPNINQKSPIWKGE